MSTNNIKFGSTSSLGAFVGLWSVLATVFHFAGFGDFAEWSVIAWPWHWSCLCIAIWYSAILGLITIGIALPYIIKIHREKKTFKELGKKMDVAKLATMRRFDEARKLANTYWPKGIPEAVMKHIEGLENASKNKSDAS